MPFSADTAGRLPGFPKATDWSEKSAACTAPAAATTIRQVVDSNHIRIDFMEPLPRRTIHRLQQFEPKIQPPHIHYVFATVAVKRALPRSPRAGNSPPPDRRDAQISGACAALLGTRIAPDVPLTADDGAFCERIGPTAPDAESRPTA